ncbi:helix-turn-helix domain-containing protein [Streptomyces uncialis]|uniref:helix-turn-helix domain-containing protein n=1 Tax=Streptomyces uncialis TaxID=1048205 RepID=UPI002E2EC2E1|nr:helix-turn-helix domain-containing protein [Streptomyces uncialis]
MSAWESETEAFARRLGEMREASGRSYGALARRVGVSASTLHRYCSGRTVPLEFAPIERLASLCGCRGEALVALHRLWVLADGERRRRQEAAAAGTQERRAATEAERSAATEPERSTAEGPEQLPGPGRGGAVPEGGDGSVSPEAPEIPEVPEAPEAPEEPEEPEVLEGVGTAAVGDSPDPSAALKERVVDGSRRESSKAVVPPELRRWRRRAARTTGLVAFATTLTLIVLLAFERSPFTSEGPDGQVGRERATGPRHAGAGATSALASGPTGSSSTSASSSALPSLSTRQPPPPARPSGSASPRATTSGPPAGPSTSAGPSRTGSRTASPEPVEDTKPRNDALPFTWGVDQHIWANGCSHSYIVDRAPAAVPPPPSVSDAEPWARSLGAVHGGDTLVRVTVQGSDEQAVVLQALRVRVAAQRPPRPRNVYGMSMGCGGLMTPRTFDADLDAARPAARSVPGNDSGVKIPAVSFPYRVSVRDPEILLVTGRTVKCDCDWYLELEWSSGDRSGSVRIDDGGRPFRTSAVQGGPAYLYDTNTRRWVPVAGEDPATRSGDDPHPASPASPDGPASPDAPDGPDGPDDPASAGPGELRDLIRPPRA